MTPVPEPRPRPRPRRRHRRRRDRLLDRLPPRPRGLDRRASLLERDRLTSGTTWHAAGLMTCFGSTSRDPHRRSGCTPATSTPGSRPRPGVATGFKPVGLIEAAADADRLQEYRRVAAFQRHLGLEVEEISPARDGRPVPLGEDRRPARRLPRARRRPGQPGRPHQRAGPAAPGNLGVRVVEGVAVERRAHRPRGAATRSSACARRAGDDRVRVRRQLRRHVGPRARRAERRGRSPTRRPSTTT